MNPAHRPIAAVPALLSLCLLAAPAPALAAPALQGAWVDQAEQRIESHRKTEVRVIVLDDAGEPVEGAPVRIEQQRHDFPLGFTLPADADWPEAMSGKQEQEAEGEGEDAGPFAVSDQPLWRCFNAVGLDGVTDWTRMSPEADAAPALGPVVRLAHQAQRAGMTVRFGGVVSADLGRNPPWLGELAGDHSDRAGAGTAEALTAALDRRLGDALRRTPGPIHHFDLYTHALDHDWLTDRLGATGLRRFFERARALNPRASLGVRFSDALIGPRQQAMVRRVVAMRDDFVPMDTAVIAQHVSQQVIQVQLQRSLEQLEALEVGVTLANLELGGHSEAAAAYNAEIVLRTAFASPSVRGIWLGPLTEDHTRTPHAALLDDAGEPTAPGRVIDRLFAETWWTEHEAAADMLGNVRTRVFAGIHRVEAALPGGRRMAMTVHVPIAPTERVIVLQP